ncbi:subunit D of translation initiation factor 3 [Chloropicon primus]|uniref:Subunit D of translation initiation factor 3 n=1 Tax=Chloropicon primus TaxID=1764295 RepID=A0A5B8MSX4_9CHLO|nr:subunit D of translation initiation factor 3 [Chloropicon primus]UPR01731.1 subunit D of translation initiation factor 3 [Chloropicon primus]|eukprot:QDZ22510.1 subunit D of translation initiation factor 3 [Chloropicon primus]
MSRFAVPEVPFNEGGWGPCTLPAHLKDVPYAPYGKNDKIGRVADWTSSGRDHHHHHGGKYDKRREKERQEESAIAASVFGYGAFQTEEEDSFSLVDNRPTYKPRYGRRPQKYVSRREREKEREEKIKLQGGPAAQAAKLQRPKRKENWNYYHRDQNRYKYAASVDIRPEWTVLEQIQLSSLNKLSLRAGEGKEITRCGTLAFYDKTYDRVTPRTEKALRKQVPYLTPNVTASEDPVFQKHKDGSVKAEGADGSGEGRTTVYATDMVLATLMCAPRSVYSWDILVKKEGGAIYLDKRTGGVIDETTVSETSPEPIAPDKESINGHFKLCKEATMINTVFPMQVLKTQDGATYDMGSKSPFAPENQPSTKGHVYKSWPLGDKYEVVVRCDVDGVMESKGQTVLANFRALNEFDPRITGVDWRQKIENQRGAVLATELKNNSNKLSKWTAQAVLGGVEVLKLGYVARTHHKDNKRHAIIGTQSFKPKDFANQINLKEDSCWGIIHAFLDLLDKMEDGTFLIFKDPNRPIVRIYETPATAFVSNYTEEYIPENEQALPSQDNADKEDKEDDV